MTSHTDHPAPDHPAEVGRLEHFPITFFAIVMGLTGLTLALHAGETALGLAPVASHVMLYVSAAIFALIAIAYALKALRHGGEVRAEWNHPVRLAFFPTVSISLLLIATATLSHHKGLAEALWAIGAALQLVLTLAVVSGWIGTRAFQHGHLSPAWFIPAVGNVVVPVAGVPLGHPEISWFFFSMGMMFWVVLLTLVVNRLIFHDPLPGRLQPTLVILIAPPAVAFIAWMRLTGEVDAFARVLINAAFVFALIVATQLPRIARLPFALSFWALSFPLAALTIASFLFAGQTGSEPHRLLALGLLGLLVLLIAALVVRTLRAIAGREICLPE
ncbi:SLAC1 anion channel family protein [Acidimangrovimonas pyrenivorans]|uniref:SLAC1 anion channel family protein n=1 Tax=Acidimangrovimonas pyrenivorans TaxID=2030798 RepID=A0ABV7AI79_9RHOB